MTVRAASREVMKSFSELRMLMYSIISHLSSPKHRLFHGFTRGILA